MRRATFAARIGAWLALVTLSGVALRPLAAQDGPPRRPEIAGVRVGFNGQYKAGYWTPLVVVLKAGPETTQGMVSVQVTDGDGATSAVVAERPVQLPGGSSALVQQMLYVKFGSTDNEVIVTYAPQGRRRIIERFDGTASDDGDMKHVPWGLRSSEELIVNVGSSAGFASIIPLNRTGDEERVHVAQIDDVDLLPTRWYGYEGVDTLVLSTSDLSVFGALQEGTARLEALDRWVKMGGRLVLLVGNNAEQALAAGEPLARFAPGRYEGRVRLNRTNEIEAWCEATQGLEVAADFHVPMLRDVRGDVVVRQGNVPFVVRSHYGFGEVTFVAADLDMQPFARWKDRPQLLNKLLRKPALGVRNQNEEVASGAVTHTGLSDLAGQLRGALDQFQGVRLVPFVLVAALVVGYILLIGPVDFLLVKKLFRRMEFTWITFPVIVIAVSLTAYKLAYWMKGDQLLVNQVDLFDVDIDESRARGTTWLNVFSPNTDAYDVTIEPLMLGTDGAAVQPLVSWMGSPSDGWGGMDASGGSPSLFQGGYAFAPALDSMHGVPIQVWSTKSLTARWDQPVEPGLAVELKIGSDGLPQGTITNNLPHALTDCMLAVDRYSYTIDELAPGEEFEIDYRVNPRDLVAELTNRRVAMDDETSSYRDYVVRHDVLSRDVPVILRSMMFYEAAGGAGHAQLRNRYQAFTDLSGQLAMGRGIFVGYAKNSAAQLRLNGEPNPDNPKNQHWTCYRFVFDVQQQDDP